MGLIDLPFPAFITLDKPGNTVWRYREDHLTSQLSIDETKDWQAARHRATAAGTLFQAHAMHCAVARKPQ